MLSRFAFTALCALLISGGSVAQAAPKNKLRINGKVASTRLQIVGGITMVPVTDVARALGQQLDQTSDGWNMRPIGGTSGAGRKSGKGGGTVGTKK
jgi:hypothetical protein